MELLGDLTHWVKVVEFNLMEIGYLWAGYEPPPDVGRKPVRGVSIPADYLETKPYNKAVSLSTERLIDAIIDGSLIPTCPIDRSDTENVKAIIYDGKGWLLLNKEMLQPETFLNLMLIKITRKNLLKFAENIGELPEFLENSAKYARKKGLKDKISDKTDLKNALNIVYREIYLNRQDENPKLTKTEIANEILKGWGKNRDSKLIKEIWEMLPDHIHRIGRPEIK